MLPKKFLLIDASSFIYRAYHAFPPLETRRGEPVGAIFGFLTLLRALLKREKPDSCLIAFDPKGGSHRKILFESYKAHRVEMPELLKGQIQAIFDILEFSGLQRYVLAGFEADDLIASAITQYAQSDTHFVIASGDKDMAQLVEDPHVLLLQEKDSPALNAAGVIEKYGVSPTQIPDYLALLGDASDNIPGVQGIGKKTAQELLKHFANIEEIYSKMEEIETLELRGKEKIKRLLQEGEELATLSKRLALLHRQIPLPFSAQDLRIARPNFEELTKRFEYYEFHSFLAQARQHQFGAQSFGLVELSHEKNFSASSTLLEEREPRAQALLTFLSAHSWFDSIFTLEESLHPSIICLSEHEGVENILLLHKEHFTHCPLSELLSDAHLFSAWQRFLSSKKELKVTASARDFFKRFPQAEQLTDPSYAFHLLLPLEATKTFEEIWSRFFSPLELEADRSAIEGAPESLEMALKLQKLHNFLTHQLQETSPKLLEVLEHVEIPLIPVLVQMERNGILVDAAQLKQLGQRLHTEADEIERQVHLLADQVFNLASSKQVQEVLFDQLALPSKLKTQKGQRSTREEALALLAPDYPIAALLLKHREVTKLRTTYAQGLLRELSEQDQRVHTHYQQLVTSTGRLSSTAPNLQNIPIKTESGLEIRRCFVAEKGYKLLSADYSQIELRILAHFSQDPLLLESFRNAEDIHRLTAAAIHGKSPEETTLAERRRAKTIVFGLIYGMSAFGVAKELKLSRKEAQSYLENYFSRYPGVKRYLEQMRAQAIEHGWVETFLGRRWLAPKLKHSKSLTQDATLRAAINAPIQGSAAELIKVAMIRLHEWIQGLGAQSGIRMLLQVHDELLFEIEETRLSEYQPKIIEFMQSALELTVPIVVNIGIGENWAEAH